MSFLLTRFRDHGAISFADAEEGGHFYSLRQSKQALESVPFFHAPVPQPPGAPGIEIVHDSDRSRRMRDAVESALSDIILLGTEEQVRLAGFTAQELVEGRHVPTHDLVVSLRYFIREALDLEPIPTDLRIPRQGPTRPQSSRGKSKASGSEDRGGRGGGGGAGGGEGMAGLDDEDESANDS